MKECSWKKQVYLKDSFQPKAKCSSNPPEVDRPIFSPSNPLIRLPPSHFQIPLPLSAAGPFIQNSMLDVRCLMFILSALKPPASIAKRIPLTSVFHLFLTLCTMRSALYFNYPNSAFPLPNSIASIGRRPTSSNLLILLSSNFLTFLPSYLPIFSFSHPLFPRPPTPIPISSGKKTVG